MRIILVDHLSPAGHKKFDAIHIKALRDLGHELFLVGNPGQFENEALLRSIPDVVIGTFPKWTCYLRPFRPITERVMGYIRLLWLQRFLNKIDYDALIFLSYDVLSLFLFRLKGNVFLINHNNISQINDSKLKLALTKCLPNNYTHIALSETMRQRIAELLPGRRVELIPHGFLDCVGSVSRPLFLEQEQLFLFCPVNSNYDKALLQKILNSFIVRDYLKNNNIYLYIKKNIEYSNDCEYIRRVTSYLTTEEYNYMLERSLAVVLPYSKEFKYRCSGIFFECVSKDKAIISSDIPDMVAYSYYGKIYFFNNADSFVHSMTQLKQMNSTKVNKDKFLPANYWKLVLERIK